MLRFLRKRGLLLKSTAAVVAIVSLSLIAVTVVGSVRIYSFVMEDCRREANNYAKQLVNSIELALAAENIEELDQQAYSFGQIEHMLFVLVYNRDNKLVASHIRNEYAYNKFKTGVKENRSYWTESLDVAMLSTAGRVTGFEGVVDDQASEAILGTKEEQLGRVVLGLSKEVVDKAFRGYSISMVIISLLVLVVSLVVTMFIVRYMVSKLESLISASRRIARGDLDFDMGHLEGEDELGSLANSFKKMRDAICDRDRELRELNSSLQKQIETRTVELVEANEKLRDEMVSRVKYQCRLQESEQLFRSLYESSQDAVLLINESFRIFDCNDRALDLFGCKSRSEVLNMSPVDFSPERQPCGIESAILFQKTLSSAVFKGSHRFEWEFRDEESRSVECEVCFSA
ncbi:MAG: HAMP domain-containing protein, partial [Sedimentisphaerales bacterium]|nr:HAMP domain-containing protein [Sedimentisphaerales bacterium]